MMRALFSGVAGLKAHQIKMDVIGNNIANVNTYGYKASRATFQDVFYQTLTGSSGATQDSGGTNASQVGYGSMVASIDVLHTRAGYASTGRSMDAYINGEGYFVTQDGAGNESYSRVGNFKFDDDGNLVDSNGKFVCGYPIQRTSSGNIVYQVKSASNATAAVGDAVIDFGPTDIFNGYNVVVQQGISDSAVIDTDNKKLTVTLSGASGDAVTTATIEGLLKAATVNGTDTTKVNAVNGVLSGIGVSSTNTSLTVADVLTSTPAVGTNATATIGGMTIDFGKTAAYNGYSIKVQYVQGPAANPTAAVSGTNEITLTLTAPSITDAAPTAAQIQTALASIDSGITVSTAGTPLISDLATDAAANNAGVTVGGLTFDFGTTSALNGYNIEVVKDTASPPGISASLSGSTITVTVAGTGTDPIPVGSLSGLNFDASLSDITLQNALKAGNFSSTLATINDITNDTQAISGGNAAVSNSALTVSAGSAPGTATGVAVKDGNASGTTNTPALDTSVAPTRIKKPGTLSDANSDGQYETEDPNDVIELTDISIGANGIISGTDKNGNIIFIGQVALANISNPDALTMDGNSYYKASNNSGDISFEHPGEKTTGSLVASGLEMSNVDLANEFSEMITTQRGFQANSRIITVGDTMLEELINLKR